MSLGNHVNAHVQMVFFSRMFEPLVQKKLRSSFSADVANPSTASTQEPGDVRSAREKDWLPRATILLHPSANPASALTEEEQDALTMALKEALAQLVEVMKVDVRDGSTIVILTIPTEWHVVVSEIACTPQWRSLYGIDACGSIGTDENDKSPNAEAIKGNQIQHHRPLENLLQTKPFSNY